MEYPVPLSSAELGYGVRLLTPQEVEKLEARTVLSIVDVEALKGGIVYKDDAEGCIFVTVRGAVVKMVFRQ
jgi:hypothetical protein